MFNSELLNYQRVISLDYQIEYLMCINLIIKYTSIWLWVSLYLVGGWPTPLKNMKVNWDHYSQYTEKIKMFQTTNQHQIWQFLFNHQWKTIEYISGFSFFIHYEYTNLKFLPLLKVPWFTLDVWIGSIRLAAKKSPTNVDDFPMKTSIRGVMDFHGDSQIRKSRPKIAKKNHLWNDSQMIHTY